MQKIVYGYTPRFECLAFVDGRVAEAMTDELAAILTAPTFRAAAEVRTLHIHNPLADSMREDGDDARDWDEPFDSLQLDYDGTWPPAVVLYTADCLPEEVVDDFATEHPGLMSYDYLAIALDDEQAVTTALRDLGYDLVRDDDLIAVLDTEDRSAVTAWHTRRIRS